MTGTSSHPQYFDPIEGASRAYLDQLQEAAIVSMCRHAYSHAPLIRETWDKAGVKPSDIRSIADFRAKAPMIDKDDQRRFRDAHLDPAGGMGPLIPGETVSIGTTSGTTGDPTPIPNWARTASEEAYIRAQWELGVRPGDHLAHIIFTYRGGHRRRMYANHGIKEIMFSMSPPEMIRLVEASRIYRPTSMSIIANPLILVLEAYFEKSGDDPVEAFRSYKGGIFGGEPLGNRLKTLTRNWGLHLVETTSLGEVASATECRHKAGFHAFEDIAYIETVDPVTGEPIADGEVGELVVTTLVDRLTPLVRFRTGDLVVIDRSQCKCGRNHARFNLLGRATDQIVVEGRSVLPREIMELIELHDECRAGLFQIIRTAREMDALALRVGYDLQRLAGAEAALADRLHQKVKEAIGVPVRIELVDEQQLLKLGPPHKIPRVTKS
jgi:phenylacetate-CoA ligase